MKVGRAQLRHPRHHGSVKLILMNAWLYLYTLTRGQILAQLGVPMGSSCTVLSLFEDTFWFTCICTMLGSYIKGKSSVHTPC